MEYRKFANRREDIYAAIRVVQAKWQRWIESCLKNTRKIPGFNESVDKEVVKYLNGDHSFRGWCYSMSSDLVDELKKYKIEAGIIELSGEPGYREFMKEPQRHWGIELDDGTIFDISINQFIPEIKVLERVGSKS